MAVTAQQAKPRSKPFAFLQNKQNRVLLILAGIFLFAYFVPFSSERVSGAVQESFLMLAEYARQHVLLCLVPAFFIAGAITVFLNQQAVIRYLGPQAKKIVAYGVASVSGTILAVCSCTVLPLFKGIYRKGAGIGPAVSFLYSGPAINVLAIVLTAKVLGFQLGVARAVGAVAFAFVIGLMMHLFFRKEDEARATDAAMFSGPVEEEGRTLGQTALYMASMIGILVFVNWAPSRGSLAVWDFIYRWKYAITGGFGLVLVYSLIRWFRKDELAYWVTSTRDFAVQILPLLFGGVLVAGFLLGRPGHMALIPERWIASLVGGNSVGANLIASVAGALMYFATLTEVPIMQGLLGAGMGQGPALALLLAGPSLSLPSILVIAGELGWKKTGTYIALVVVLSTIAGLVYGAVIV
ncbi:MAG: permease [Spirochaetales bacterium]|nr:permease [Spirochaetales bacterium]